jgi:hypothetical protein
MIQLFLVKDVKFVPVLNYVGSGSSVSIMSDYELDDRAIEVRSSAEAR